MIFSLTKEMSVETELQITFECCLGHFKSVSHQRIFFAFVMHIVQNYLISTV